MFIVVENITINLITNELTIILKLIDYWCKYIVVYSGKFKFNLFMNNGLINHLKTKGDMFRYGNDHIYDILIYKNIIKYYNFKLSKGHQINSMHNHSEIRIWNKLIMMKNIIKCFVFKETIQYYYKQLFSYSIHKNMFLC